MPTDTDYAAKVCEDMAKANEEEYHDSAAMRKYAAYQLRLAANKIRNPVPITYGDIK
jgi:hypothetical protein